MRKFVLILLAIVPLLAASQIKTYNLPPKTYYKNAKITLKDFTKYECKSLVIKTDSVHFFHINRLSTEILPLDNVDYIRVQTGNQGLKWCGYGALLMGLIAAINVSYAQENNSPPNPGNVILGFSIGGAVFGGLIGLAIPKWKTYYLN